MSRRSLLALTLALGACGGSSQPPQPPPPAAASATPAPPPAPATSADPLGPRPIPKPPTAFTPPAPRVLEGPGKSKVWLLERHGLPLVTIAVVVPYGSAAEPPEKAGLSFATADMLDEGAGKLDALGFSQALNDLGAKFASSTDRDSSIVSLQLLTSKLDQGLPLLADAVIRPKHDKKDWTRVSTLWNNALKNRAHDPNDVARVVTSLLYYGDKHPYGHPPDGTLESAKRIQLGDISKWHRTIWRPDEASFVVVGDVTAEQITAKLAGAFAGWKPPPGAPLKVVDPPAVTSDGLRTFVVDK
ncbi:MAG TPA: pitrilysin family protein, partial [Polyangiaceae bacterium]|nr:pitrilysin family protein [Polyangiaceae bacterium]